MGLIFTDYDEKSLLNKLTNFNSDLQDYVYDLEPARKNLFWAGNFIEHKNSVIAKDAATGKNANLLNNLRSIDNAEFRIRNISIPMPGMTFDSDSQAARVLHTSFLKDLSLTKTITISWEDDAWRTIRKYHLDWINRWYDRNKDCLRNGPDGKLRGLDIILYHYKEGNSVNGVLSPLDSIPVPEPILCIHCRGLRPSSAIPELSLDATGSKEDNLTIQYALNRCVIEYNVNLMFKEGNEFPTKEEDFNSDIDRGIWNPQGIGDENSWNNEAWRMSRSITQQISGEGEIS